MSFTWKSKSFCPTNLKHLCNGKNKKGEVNLFSRMPSQNLTRLEWKWYKCKVTYLFYWCFASCSEIFYWYDGGRRCGSKRAGQYSGENHDRIHVCLKWRNKLPNSQLFRLFDLFGPGHHQDVTNLHGVCKKTYVHPNLLSVHVQRVVISSLLWWWIHLGTNMLLTIFPAHDQFGEIYVP